MQKNFDPCLNVRAYQRVESLDNNTDKNQLEEYRKQRLCDMSAAVEYICTHVYAGRPLRVLEYCSGSSCLLYALEEKGVLVRFSSEVEYSYPEQMKKALNKLSTGMKVVMDLGMIVAEEGLVSEGEEVIAIAGTSRSGGRFQEGGGADTAVVMVPRRSDNFNRLPEKKDDRREIREIICKPR